MIKSYFYSNKSKITKIKHTNKKNQENPKAILNQLKLKNMHNWKSKGMK